MRSLWVQCNGELLDLWCRHAGGPQKKFPAVYHDQEDSPELVVLGLNPSKTLAEIEEFQWTDDTLQLEELLAHCNKTYTDWTSGWTERMQRFAEECGASSVAQADVFRVMGSDANEVLEQLGWKGNCLGGFGEEHSLQTKALIQRLQPRVVVVASMHALRIMQRYWNLEGRRDLCERHGEYALGDIRLVCLGMWWKGTIPVPSEQSRG